LEAEQAKAYFRKQVGKIEKNLYKASFLFDEESIHDLRVAIKRLRALFKILNENKLAKQSSIRYVRCMKKIYKPLGKLRDLQIKHNLFQSYQLNRTHNYPFFEKWLKSQEFRAKVQLRHVFKSFSISSFYRFKHQPPLVARKEFALDNSEVINKRLSKIRVLLQSPLSNDKLHDVRKKLKEIYYFLEMNEIDQVNIDGLTLQLEEIKHLEDLIGDWRDNLLFRQEMHLNGYKDHKLPTVLNEQGEEVRWNPDDQLSLIKEVLKPYE